MLPGKGAPRARLLWARVGKGAFNKRRRCGHVRNKKRQKSPLGGSGGPLQQRKINPFEALLETAGAPVKKPADPRNRPMTTEIRLGHCSYLGDSWTVLDCPGSIEFAHQTCAALAMVDIAVVVCEPTQAKAATVAPLLKTLKDEGVPHIIFINKIDTLDGSVADTLAALQAFTGSPLVLRQMPIFDGPTCTGYVDLMSERAYRYRKGQASELMQIPADILVEEQAALGRLVETLADHDDALLEKVLEDIKPTPEELYRDMRKDLVAGSVIEVLVGAAEHINGVRRLWKALPSETAGRRGIVPGGAPRAQVFKTVYAGHTGKLSYVRIWSGTVTDGAQLGGTRLGGIYRFVNGELTKATEAKQGEIVAFGRLDGVPTGATLSPGGQPEPLPFPQPDPPVYAMAVATTDRKDDVKLSGALHKLAEEDPTLFVTQEGETVLHGQGEMHLQTAVEHLARDYGLKLATHKPAVAYRETIRKPVHEHGRLEAADRRSRPVRRREDRRGPSGTWRGLPVHRQDRRRRGAAQLHPLGRRGGRGGHPQGAVRLSGGGPVGDAGRRRVPLGRQFRHGVQDRDPDRHERGLGEGRTSAAGTGGSRNDQRAERLHGAGATAADRTARPDPGVRRAGGVVGDGTMWRRWCRRRNCMT